MILRLRLRLISTTWDLTPYHSFFRSDRCSLCGIAELDEITQTCELRRIETRMNDQSEKKAKNRFSHSENQVIVLVIRGRRVYDNWHPFLKDETGKQFICMARI